MRVVQRRLIVACKLVRRITSQQNDRQHTNLHPSAQCDVRCEIAERLIHVGRKVKVRVDVPRDKDVSSAISLHRLNPADLHDPVDPIRIHALIYRKSAQKREDDRRLQVHVQVKLRRGSRRLAIGRECVVRRDRSKNKAMGGDCRLDARNSQVGGEGVCEGDGHVGNVVRDTRRIQYGQSGAVEELGLKTRKCGTEAQRLECVQQGRNLGTIFESLDGCRDVFNMKSQDVSVDNEGSKEMS